MVKIERNKSNEKLVPTNDKDRASVQVLLKKKKKIFLIN